MLQFFKVNSANKRCDCFVFLFNDKALSPEYGVHSQITFADNVLKVDTSELFAFEFKIVARSIKSKYMTVPVSFKVEILTCKNQDLVKSKGAIVFTVQWKNKQQTLLMANQIQSIFETPKDNVNCKISEWFLAKDGQPLQNDSALFNFFVQGARINKIEDLVVDTSRALELKEIEVEMKVWLGLGEFKVLNPSP